jgi:HPt (histidine-containing phosphotransfer) domain-containing protein
MTDLLSAPWPLFDEDQMATLRDALGDEELRAMLARLPAAIAQAQQKIEEAVAAGNLEAARRAAHGLKGVATNFGAARIAATAREMELETASIEAMQERLPVLLDAMTMTFAALAERERAQPRNG